MKNKIACLSAALIITHATVVGRCETPKFALPVNIDQIRAKLPSLTPAGEAM